MILNHSKRDTKYILVDLEYKRFSPSYMRPFYGETNLKQEAHKLKSIIKLFNPSMRLVSQ